jgi:hypothetical protein
VQKGKNTLQEEELNLLELEEHYEELMRILREQIIEEWRVASMLKSVGVSRESFIDAMISEIPRLASSDYTITNQETFLKTYYDNVPYWDRRKK